MSRFKLYTGMLRAFEVEDAAGVTKKHFKTTASSTIKDQAGHEITYPAIEKMASQARNNMTIFLNHSYNVPEDVLGSVSDAMAVKRGTDGEGNDLIDLDFDIELAESNPRALQAWDAIKSGVKLGTSIGAIVRHATKKKGGGVIIDDLDLMEASLVGIPANPRTWVQYAVKSLSAADDPDPIIDDEVDGDFDVSLAAPDVPVTEPELETKDVAVETTPVELDKEAARTQVTVTVNSDPAQEAPKSAPGNAKDALLDETAEGDDQALGDTVTRDISGLTVLVNKLTTDLLMANGQLTTKDQEVARITQERDDALANVELAKQLFARIEQLPLRRKTALTPNDATTKDYRKFAGYLADDVIQLLEK